MSNVLVTGSNGQLGSELKDLATNCSQYTFYFTDVKELDITNHSDVESFIFEKDIQIIVNCAAHTAVDRAEEEEVFSDKLNHLSVRNFAEIAKRKSIKLVHISTDYVFDGENHKPYLESDIPNPKSVYGITKLAGELAMQEINPKNSIIIRTSWVYSRYGNNFVKTMLRLGVERDELNVIFDQVGTPTYAGDLAKAILEIIPQLNNSEMEVFHFSNEGACSWYDFAKSIFEFKKIEIRLNPIESSQYPTAAKRPFYSILNKGKIKNKFKIEIPHWRYSLKKCLKLIDEK